MFISTTVFKGIGSSVSICDLLKHFLGLSSITFYLFSFILKKLLIFNIMFVFFSTVFVFLNKSKYNSILKIQSQIYLQFAQNTSSNLTLPEAPTTTPERSESYALVTTDS